MATDRAVGKGDPRDAARAYAGLAFQRGDQPVRADLRLGTVDRRGRTPPDLVAGSPTAMERNQWRVRGGSYHCVEEVAGGVGQDSGSTESSLSPMCCKIFLLDICNRSVLLGEHDGESVSKDTSPRFRWSLALDEPKDPSGNAD